MTTPGTFTVEVSDADVATLRQMVAVGIDEMSDQTLAEIIATTLSDDGTFNFNLSAAEAWRRRAAGFATLVDISESGSSRKMSDLHKNALAMSKSFDDKDKAEVAAAVVISKPAPRTRRIVRR